MKYHPRQLRYIWAFGSLVSLPALAAGVCEGYGPQAPRDIDQLFGTNPRVFSLAPDYENMNLCNIHFHAQAEHKARDFSIPAANGAGYRCAIGTHLTEAELAMPEQNYCKGLNPGDTIEVHWVHTSCDTTPGKGLGSCLSETCSTPNLRVESQVFTVVNDPNALDFREMSYGGNQVAGYHQARSIPASTGAPVEFLGSTTGPNYDASETCSPLQVTWSVRPHCARVDINSLSAWCKDNVFEENYAHGVRPLVTNPALLSEIE